MPCMSEWAGVCAIVNYPNVALINNNDLILDHLRCDTHIIHREYCWWNGWISVNIIKLPRLVDNDDDDELELVTPTQAWLPWLLINQDLTQTMPNVNSISLRQCLRKQTQLTGQRRKNMFSQIVSHGCCVSVKIRYAVYYMEFPRAKEFSENFQIPARNHVESDTQVYASSDSNVCRRQWRRWRHHTWIWSRPKYTMWNTPTDSTKVSHT